MKYAEQVRKRKEFNAAAKRRIRESFERVKAALRDLNALERQGASDTDLHDARRRFEVACMVQSDAVDGRLCCYMR